LVVDEIDSFSKPDQLVSNHERNFKRFLKKLMNYGEPQKPSILPKATKGTTSQGKADREEKK
jgi:hypothetical protein